MKPILQALLVSAVLVLTSGQASPLPILDYDELADHNCSEGKSSEIRPEMVSELRQRLPEMRKLWAQVEPEMTRAVKALTNKPFEPPSPVRLTLCNVPSNSFRGPTVNMRYALNSFTATPVPVRYKIDTAFHEELHPFVDANVPAQSGLLMANASEPQCVRDHLHLLALQKAVLLYLKDDASLAQVVMFDGQLPSDCYKRAWALVNSKQGTYQQYVAELAQ